MTGALDREVLEAVAIVVVTTAALGAGRGDERSGHAPGRRRRVTSRLAVSLALGAVAVVAAAAVVVVFGGARRDAVPARAVVVPAARAGTVPSSANGASLRARIEELRVRRGPGEHPRAA